MMSQGYIHDCKRILQKIHGLIQSQQNCGRCDVRCPWMGSKFAGNPAPRGVSIGIQRCGWCRTASRSGGSKLLDRSPPKLAHEVLEVTAKSCRWVFWVAICRRARPMDLVWSSCWRLIAMAQSFRSWGRSPSYPVHNLSTWILSWRPSRLPMRGDRWFPQGPTQRSLLDYTE